MEVIYEHDRRLANCDDSDLFQLMEPVDVLDTESDVAGGESLMSIPMTTDTIFDAESEHDWLSSIFGDSSLVYNDRNLGEAVTQPCIKTDHSYSTNSLSHKSVYEEMDGIIFSTDTSCSQDSFHRHKEAFIGVGTTDLSFTGKTEGLDLHFITTDQPERFEQPEGFSMLPFTKFSSTTSSGLYVQDVDLTQSTAPHGDKIWIKEEPTDEAYEQMLNNTVHAGSVLPPTPPSSTGSDSDCSQSPQRSAPNSPQHRHQMPPVRVYHYCSLSAQTDNISSTAVSSTLLNTNCSAAQTSHPLLLSPMQQSDVLILTEEEKRTLISEGYSLPSSLPLTKQEERNLKKIRRKIKNKISAQESRRKKKEYMEALEKRVAAVDHENGDLKRKMESLESSNRSLISQLHSLQSLVGRIPKAAVAASSAEARTVLMVLVLCFAVFLGGSGFASLSPMSFGYKGLSRLTPDVLSLPAPSSFKPPPYMKPVPARVEDTRSDYTTPNLRSRVLMAFTGEEGDDDWCVEYRPVLPPVDGDDRNTEWHTVQKSVHPAAEELMPTVNASRSLSDDAGEGRSIAMITIAMPENVTSTGDAMTAVVHPDSMFGLTSFQQQAADRTALVGSV